MEQQIVKYTAQQIEKINRELPVTKHPNLFEEVLIFVGKISIACNRTTEQNTLEIIASELTDYFQKNKVNQTFTFQEFCNIVKPEIYRKEFSSLSVNLFISTFENWLKDNKRFKSAAIVQKSEPDYVPPKPDPLRSKKIANEYFFKFKNNELSDFEKEFSLPTIYPYMREKGFCNFSEEEKMQILGDDYISPEQAENAVKGCDRKTMLQFQKNKGTLVLEQFKITINKLNNKEL